MQVTRDMVRDLLPVYLAGEASADTRAAVEAHLAEDPKLREIVELLGRKNFWLGFALIFSSAPLLLRPLWLADLGMLIGLGGWAAFLVTCGRLKATGLEAPRRVGVRALWSGIGALVGMAGGYLIDQQTGWHGSIYDVPAMTFVLALWIGERLHQIPTPGELNRPTTLFGK